MHGQPVLEVMGEASELTSDERELGAFIKAAAAIDVPIVIQDHPAGSGVPMRVDFINPARTWFAAEAPACRTVKLEVEPTPPIDS